MTEEEWFAATEATVMGEAVLRTKRASPRVLRLALVAFWSWQSNRLRSKADKTGLQTAVALLEQWAETGVEPSDPARLGYMFFTRGARPALRNTLSLPDGWEGKYGRDANSRLVWVLREVFGNPFAAKKRKRDPHRWSSFDLAWRTDTVLNLAKQMYDTREFSPMPILADALQDAGCTNEDMLAHARATGEHVRGCWVLDLVLGNT